MLPYALARFAPLLSTVATAGDGPWTLPERSHNVYVGLHSYRYGEYASVSGEQALGTDVIATGITGVWTTGLANDLEMELQVPLETARVGDPSAAACSSAATPRGWCAPTAGLGDLALLVKGRLVDEVFTGPMTVSLVGGVRTGEAYARRRGRLTTLGDGQTDLGLGLSVGRTDVLGRGWYRMHATGGYWYRLPHVTEPSKVPADELRYDVSAVLAVHPYISIGPAVFGFRRLGGVDIAAADFRDPNAFSSLDASQVQVGGKLGVHPPGGRGTVSLGVLRTVAAENNPVDTLAISLGVGFFFERMDAGVVDLPPLPPPE